jgi:hypothetical protein
VRVATHSLQLVLERNQALPQHLVPLHTCSTSTSPMPLLLKVVAIMNQGAALVSTTHTLLAQAD